MTYASRLAPGRAEPLGGLAERYRALRKRLSDMLGRGHLDYSTLTALSQEIGRIRQKLEQRHRERNERRDQRNPPDSAARD